MVCAVSLILSYVYYNTVLRKMINSCVLAIFHTWLHKGKEAINMAYNKPKTVAKSAKKTSFVAGCPTHSPHDWGGKGNCVSCEVAR